MPTHINLNQLRMFYLAARCKSMAVAAKQLFVSPPAVTMQIRKLEQWLGIELFHRSRGRLVLTDQGQNLYRLAGDIFSQVEVLEQHVEELMHRREGELLLGTHHIPAQYFLPDLLSHVRTICPDLRVRMVLGTQDLSFEKLLQQLVHVALMVGDPSCSSVNSLHLFDEQLAFVTSPIMPLGSVHTLSVQELNHIPLVLQQTGTGIQTVVREYLSRHNVTPSFVMENISSDVIKQFLLREPGAAFIVRFAVQKELDAGILHEIQILEGNPVAHFYLAYLAQQRLPFVLQRFLDSVATFPFS